MNSQDNQSMDDLVQTISKLALAQQQLARQAEQLYSVEVDSILRDQCRDPQRIERLLDGMLDFCFDDEMLRLFKKLCRYYFKIDQGATVYYVRTYREMWDEVKPVEFDGIRMQVVLNNSTLRPKLWIEKTGAIGFAGNELKPLDGFLKGLGYLK